MTEAVGSQRKTGSPKVASVRKTSARRGSNGAQVGSGARL